MRYLADLLTFSRIILALVIIYLSSSRIEIGAILILFLIGELTDAFDGTLSAKFPFPKNKIPKYRKYAAKYDMLADGLLAFSMLLFFTLRINFMAGLLIFLFYTVFGLIVEYTVYGKLMGHPDNCTKNSLMKKNFPLAKKIILIRRNIYLSLMMLVSIWALFAASWPLAVKITILLIGLIISAGMWFFLSQRRHHISRDAVEIEEKLAKETKSPKKS